MLLTEGNLRGSNDYSSLQTNKVGTSADGGVAGQCLRHRTVLCCTGTRVLFSIRANKGQLQSTAQELWLTIKRTVR